MKKFFNSLASYSWGVLLFAILFLAAGICLISFPENALPNTILTISIITMVFGVILMLLALLDKKRQGKFFFFLLGGACTLFAGIYLLIKRNSDAIAILALFIGVVMMIDGSFKLHTAMQTKQYKNVVWWILFVLSILTIVGGLYLVKWPPENVKVCSVVMGLFMILDAIQNIFITFYEPYYMRKQLRENAEETVKTAEEIEHTQPVAAIESSKTVNNDNDEKAKKHGFSLFRKHKKTEDVVTIDETKVSETNNSVNAEPDVDYTDYPTYNENCDVVNADATETESVSVGEDKDE